MKKSKIKSKDIKYCVLGIIFSAAFLLLALRGINFAELGRVLLYAKWSFIIPFFLLIGGFFWIKAVRWSLLLEPVVKIPGKYLVASMMMGVALNYIFFAYIGEVARAFFLAKQTRLSKSSILGTILLERLFDVIVLLGFLVIGLFLSTQEVPQLGSIGIAFAVTAAVLLGLIVFCVYNPKSALAVVKKLTSPFSLQTSNYIVKRFEMGFKGFQSISSPRLLGGTAAASLAMWLIMGFCNYLAILAVGIQVPYYVTFLIMALIALGVTLPNSPGHIGVIELCYVIVLKAYGVSSTDAFAAGLIFHVVLYTSVILFGVSIIRYLGMTVHELKDKAEAFGERAG